MKLAVLVAAVLAGCAGFDGSGLVPGRSTVAQVEAVMGRAADKRPGAGGETVYYPVPKWFLAHVSPDGVLRETYLIDDPNRVQHDSPRRRLH